MNRRRSAAIAAALAAFAEPRGLAQEPPPAPPAAEAPLPAPEGEKPAAPAPEEEKTTRWVFQWEEWGGLHLGMIQKTSLTNPKLKRPFAIGGRPLVDFEEVKLTSTIGVRLAFDGAAFHTTESLTGFDDGVELRRARLFLKGDWTLLLPITYSIDLGYTPGKFTLSEAWLLFPDVKVIGRTQVGQFQPPQGLDVINSSWAITFMEPAAPLQALAPGTEAGIEIGKPVFSERARWRLGIFGGGAGGTEYGLTAKSYGSVIGRATWLPAWSGMSREAAVPRFLHLGLSTNLLLSASDSLRFQSRPESYIAPTVIDTGDLSAKKAVTIGAEAAFVNGPFSVQGEFLHSWVDLTTGTTPNFGGWYASASWFLTGESRPYDPATATFTRISPRKEFDWKAKSWGAFELAVRYSFTNLTDGEVAGGRLNMLMGGMNWYLTPHIRFYVNAGRGRVTGTAEVGKIFLIQGRLAIFM